MFKAGTYIVCGQHGVCRVEEIGKLGLSEASKEKEYYTLRKVYFGGGLVYVPTDSDKIIMRPVCTRTEAEALIDHMNEIEEMKVVNEKKRDEMFKQALRSGDNVEVVRVLKNLQNRKKERYARGKRITASDERFTKLAEDTLYGELAISLDIDKRQVSDYIKERIGA